jgi:hypothetical protein
MSLLNLFSNIRTESKRRERGEQHIRRIYREKHGKELDKGTPRTFAEKLFRRMLVLNKRGNRTYSALSDKFAVRDHIRQKIGDKYLVELLWSGTDAQQIPFDTLPERYIIKANHGSGMVIRVDGPIDRALVIEQVAGWLRTDYGLADHEHHYTAIPRRILVEEFLEDGHALGPLNYSFWSFHGEAAVIQVDNRDRSINPFYDIDWNKLPLTTRRDKPDVDIPKPANLTEMLDIARTLSKGFDFVRVDLYTTGSRVYFGELTFTPGTGRFRFLPEEWDVKLGELWK